MMTTFVKNIDDLDSEIARLGGIKLDQQVALSERFKSPSAIFSTVLTLFPKKEKDSEVADSGGFFKQDMVSLVSRFVLPLLLNKTLFRNSNFLIKALVGLVSQKASPFINEGSVSTIWDKAKLLFNKLTKKKEEPEEMPYPDLHYMKKA